MNRAIRPILLMVLALAGVARLWAVGDAPGLYQKGMDAYLQGDYDQAILCAAKSLELDPTYTKSKDLLSVLIVEKEQGEQTEIWLDGKQRNLPAPKTTADQTITAELNKLKSRVKKLEGRRGFDELEHRIQVVADLMEKTTDGQYQELRDAQVQTQERLETLVKGQTGQGSNLFWLFVLVCLSLVLSVWAHFRRGPKPARRLTGENDLG